MLLLRLATKMRCYGIYDEPHGCTCISFHDPTGTAEIQFSVTIMSQTRRDIFWASRKSPTSNSDACSAMQYMESTVASHPLILISCRMEGHGQDQLRERSCMQKYAECRKFQASPTLQSYYRHCRCIRKHPPYSKRSRSRRVLLST